MTTIAASAASGAAPLMLWLRERGRRQREQIHNNVQVAQTLGHGATLRDHETGEHNYRVAYLASLFGETWGLDKKSLRSLMKGAFLHDLGKIGIPDRVLLKPGAHDEEERTIMRQHPELGRDMLADLPWFDNALPVVLHHHERYDGSGYPGGLAGSDIPIIARLFAVIDVFDALVSARPYKTAFSMAQTLDIIKNESGRHFAPEVVEAFVRHIPGYVAKMDHCSEPEIKALLVARRKKMFGV